MKKNKLKQLKEEYMDIPIPEELDSVVNKAVNSNISYKTKEHGRFRKFVAVAASTAAMIALLGIGVNTSPAFAESLSQVPIINNIVKVLTLREYSIDEGTYNADIKTPEISGLKDENLQNSLNEKYLEENEKLYEEFLEDVEYMKAEGGGHLGVDSGYVVKTDTDKILSVGRYVVNTVASSSTTFKYDTIDKQKEILITLPSLFKDDSYIDVLSENVIEQMKELNKADENKVYWIKDIKHDLPDLFESISKEQGFYINDENKLVISFDKYEVAPGYMGIQEFVIPTEVISEILVGDDYIK